MRFTIYYLAIDGNPKLQIVDSRMGRIEAVLFDWGGVLIDDPAPGLIAYCARALGVSAEECGRAHARHAEPLQKGSIEEKVFWQRVCGDLKRPAPDVPSLWGDAFRAVYVPRKPVFDLAARLRKDGYKTAVLSNTEAAPVRLFNELHCGLFDAEVFSCLEGTAKPERKIYEIAARKLRTSLERCAFIDDRMDFIAGALATGMKAVQYKNVTQVVKGLAELGVSVDG